MESQRILEQKSCNQMILVSWHNFAYQTFMIQLLNSLEPIVLEPSKMFQSEKQQVIEKYFITKGTVLAGYQLNQKF